MYDVKLVSGMLFLLNCCILQIIILISIHFTVFHGRNYKVIKHAEGQVKDARSLIHTEKASYVLTEELVERLTPLLVYNFS